MWSAIGMRCLARMPAHRVFGSFRGALKSQVRVVQTPSCCTARSCSSDTGSKGQGEMDSLLAELYHKENSGRTKEASNEFIDEDAKIIYDVDEERAIVAQMEEAKLEQGLQDEPTASPGVDPRYACLNLERGVTGVFDIEDMVETLKLENCRDIWVIEIPAVLSLYQYMVIATCRSKRHLAAATASVRKVYLLKKNRSDVVLQIEGRKQQNGWIAIDTGSIAVHLFLDDIRKHYDLESLWSIGSELDSKLTSREEGLAEEIILSDEFLAEFEPDDEKSTIKP